MTASRDQGLRVLIVDDEQPARRKVRRFVDADPDVAIVYEAPNGSRALDVIRDESPDVIFLDIQMPGLDGFGILESLAEEVMPQVVFVTAYDAYALRAFEISAVDYLLKPFDAGRFARAFQRAKEAIRDRSTREDAERLRRVLTDVMPRASMRVERLLVDAGGRSVMVRVADIDRIEADRNYVRVHVGDHAYRLRSTINELDHRLDSASFLRVSRSVIVNADRIVELEPVGHGDSSIRLRDGTRVRLSRRYRERLAGVSGLSWGGVPGVR